MRSLVLESGKNLIHHANSVSEEFNAIIKPLFQDLPFSYFGYNKIFKSGHYLSLSSNPLFIRPWINYHVANDLSNDSDKKFFSSNNKKEFLEQIKTVPQDSFYKYLWPIDKEKMPGLSLCNEFNMYHGINMINNTADYFEDLVFAAPVEKEQVTDVYLNNFHIIERFITYFKNKAHYLINPIDKKHLAFSPFLRKEVHERMDNLDVGHIILNRKKFFEDTQLNKMSFNNNSGICLTKKNLDVDFTSH